MEPITEYLTLKWPEIVTLLKYVGSVYLVGMIIEYFFAAEKNQPLKNLQFNLIYTINFIVLNTLLFGLFIQIKNPVVQWVGGPFFTLPFGSSYFQQFLHGFVFFLIFDFFYYWFHRFQHTFKWFWAQHALHHSEESLNVTTGQRHHWLEDSLRVFIIFIPMSILFKFDVQQTGLIWATFQLWGYFIHLNLKLDMKWLTPVLAGPQLHRIHHSKLKPHLDKNYAAFFPIYDIIFGTYFKPSKNEYPITGLYSDYDMNTIQRANFYPFTYWAKRIKKLISSS